MKSEPWIQTFTGKKFFFLNPRPEDVEINDIAHALARICRYTGHCNRFYSVAEHCYYISQQVSPENALWALLHDAVEAYVGDVSSPLKSLLPEYKKIESNIERVIWSKFGLEGTQLPSEVKIADLRMLATEVEQILGPPPDLWSNIQPPYSDLQINGWSSAVAEDMFKHRFLELYVHPQLRE